MAEIINVILDEIVGKDSYMIDFDDTPSLLTVNIWIDNDKIARTIGRFGKTARAIKTIVRAAYTTPQKRCDVYLKER